MDISVGNVKGNGIDRGFEVADGEAAAEEATSLIEYRTELCMAGQGRMNEGIMQFTDFRVVLFLVLVLVLSTDAAIIIIIIMYMYTPMPPPPKMRLRRRGRVYVRLWVWWCTRWRIGQCRCRCRAVAEKKRHSNLIVPSHKSEISVPLSRSTASRCRCR